MVRVLKTRRIVKEAFIILKRMKILHNSSARSPCDLKTAQGWSRHVWRSGDSLGFQINNPDSFRRMFLPDVRVDLWRLFAAQIAVRTLESGLVAALVSEVAITIALQGETVQALGAIIESLLRLSGWTFGGHHLDFPTSGTYDAQEGVHDVKIWKQKSTCKTRGSACSVRQLLTLGASTSVRSFIGQN